MIADAAIIAIAGATKAVAEAVQTRDKRIMSMLASDDAEVVQSAKNDLVREDEGEKFLHDLGKPFRDLMAKLAEQ